MQRVDEEKGKTHLFLPITQPASSMDENGIQITES